MGIVYNNFFLNVCTPNELCNPFEYLRLHNIIILLHLFLRN